MSLEAAFRSIVRAAGGAFLLFTAARTWADPDLWGHVRFGRDILLDGLPRVDPYSFTSDIRWTNHEWLAEVLMYAAWAAGGNSGLVMLKMLTLLATLSIVRIAIGPVVPSHPVRDALLVLTIVGSWSRVFVLRPQVFSLVLFALLLWVLLASERGTIRRMWLLPVLFTIWVNAHGGWLVGIGTLAIWAIATALWHQARIPRVMPIAVVGLSLAATLVNPYGWHMWSFLGGTVSFERADINDWQPLYRSGPEVILPWLLTAIAGSMALYRRPRSVALPHLLIVACLAAGSLRVNRLDAFFTLAVVMLLAPQFARFGGRTSPRPLWNRQSLAAAALATVIGAVLVLRSRDTLLCVRLDGPWMPEREVGSTIEAYNLRGRLLTWFDWGQYVIWHFSPDLKVSLDGRRETVYSSEFIADHLRLYFDPGAAGEFLESLNADYAWVPRDLPLVSVLDDRGWTRIHTGPASVVYARHKTAPLMSTPAHGEPCFPGP